jgi:transcriptional regulator with XRE-family HTH domain
MISSDHKRQVGKNLSLLFQALGRQDAEIARSVGVSNSKLGNWKRGANYIDPYVATQLCERYGVTMDWIFRGRLYGLPTELADRLVSLMNQQ